MYVQGNLTPAVEITGLTYGDEGKDWVSHYFPSILLQAWSLKRRSESTVILVHGKDQT